MSTSYRVSAKGLIMMQNQVLLVRKPDGYWSLPGGRLEEGETPEDAMSREVFEETAIVCQAADLLHSFIRPRSGLLDIFIVVYHASTDSTAEDIRISDEHDDVRLVSFSEAGNLKMEHGFRRSLRLAEADYSQ